MKKGLVDELNELVSAYEKAVHENKTLRDELYQLRDEIENMKQRTEFWDRQQESTVNGIARSRDDAIALLREIWHANAERAQAEDTYAKVSAEIQKKLKANFV